MESHISRLRPQRVYDLAINLTPPMSLLLMLQLLHYLAAFQYLCFCQDRWGTCPAALTGLEINDFIKERLQKMYSGKINSPECTVKLSMKRRSTVTSLAHRAEVTSRLENMIRRAKSWWKGCCFCLNTRVIKGSWVRGENALLHPGSLWFTW